MGKRLILVLALALLVGLTFSAAYAEVQNVKVSGDIIASGVVREHFNLQKVLGDRSALKQNFLMSQVRVRVDADLTDNVMATVRLINERIWNGQNDTATVSAATNNTNIDLDLAYVTLKEFLYSPLTLTVGRQEIKFGNGLVIGNAKVIGTSSSIPTDLTERKSFDAIRATLDYNPLVVDLVYAQVKQANSNDKMTISLSGINAKYALNKKTDVSAYYWLKNDRNFAGREADKLSTVGVLISSNPIENLVASLEAAYQFGRNNATNDQENHDAWALQAMADYTFAKVKTTPKIGGSYTYLTGNTTDTQQGQKVNRGWDPMFYDQKLNNIVYTLLPFSNMHAFNLKASMKPVDDITLSAVYGYYIVAQKQSAAFTVPHTYDNGTTYYAGTYTGKKDLGNAIDGTVTYDYTEDVQLGLTAGYFIPGQALSPSTDQRNAAQVIGSMKVTF